MNALGFLFLFCFVFVLFRLVFIVFVS